MQINDGTANKWHNITGNGLVTLPGKWELVALVINTKGGSSNTATIYDDVANEETPSRKIATIDTTESAKRLDYGIPMLYGINIRVSTGTSANMTVIYRERPTLTS